MPGVGVLVWQAVHLPVPTMPCCAMPCCAGWSVLQTGAGIVSVAPGLVALAFSSIQVAATAARPGYQWCGDRRPPNRFEGMRKHLGHFYPELICYL